VAVPVGVAGPAALAAGEVDVVSGAGPAEPSAVFVEADEWVALVAAGALGRRADDGGAAAMADRSDRPVGLDRQVPSAAGAPRLRLFVAGAAGVADRLVGGGASAGTQASAA
jgi:hypothetical protein